MPKKWIIQKHKTYSWIFRYKLHHLPFWFIYHYLSWALIVGSFREPAVNILHGPYPIKFFFYVVFQAIGVYFNFYFLIPRFLEKGKYIPYILLLLITITLTAGLIVPGYYVTAWVSTKTFEELFNRKPEEFMYLFKINALPSTIASMTLAMSMKLGKNWIESKRREQALQKEKLETELNFLKSQLNPHFLFNTINSIFVLINKNPKMASESLAKFSDLLRYQLYESNEHKIPIAQEIEYLTNFIDLEKLRQSKDLELHTAIESEPLHHLKIAPFMLITFTENAFKHVSNDKDKPNWIRLNLAVDGNKLQFKISNSVASKKINDVIRYGGIGLRNVQRRLDLLYPGQHQLHVHHDENTFAIDLLLNLADVSESQRISYTAPLKYTLSANE